MARCLNCPKMARCWNSSIFMKGSRPIIRTEACTTGPCSRCAWRAVTKFRRGSTCTGGTRDTRAPSPAVIILPFAETRSTSPVDSFVLIAFQQQIFEQPDEQCQTLIVAVAAGVVFGHRQPHDSVRPNDVEELQQQAGRQA